MKEKKIHKIALGGGCHWCTEAVFQALKGVREVEQGYVISKGEAAAFSEAVVVHFDPEIIPLKTLIEVHLYTHNSTSNHSMRGKYRSAVYTFSNEQRERAERILQKLQKDFDKELVTKINSFVKFKPSLDYFQNYYQKDPEKPFCKTYIEPKLKLIIEKFSGEVKENL